MKSLKKCLFFCCLLGLWMCNQPLKTKDASYQLVENGIYPLKIKLPASAQAFTYFKVMDTKNKKIYPAQKWDNLTLVLLSDTSQPTSSQYLKIEGANEPFFSNQINIEKTNTKLAINKNKKPVLEYQITEQLPEGKPSYYKRGGFIHPLYSPAGKILTDDFPEGHTHQHAVFFAFVNNQYKGEALDFWNQHQQTGTIRPNKIISYSSGPVFGKFQTEQDHISLKHGTILKEKWDVTIFNSEPYQIVIHTTLTSIAEDTLFIKDYHYGGMAFRGTKVWNKVDSLHFQNEPTFLTNEGKTRITANHSRPLWSAMSGLIDETKTGVAILGHPSNFQYPEPIRIHPSMPYYCIAPMVSKAFTIAPKGVFEAAYTFVVYDGEVPTQKLNGIAESLYR